MAPEELTTIPLTMAHRFGAELVLRACQAEGIECELLTADESGWAREMIQIQPHRLLVRAEDRARVEEIVARMSSPTDPDDGRP
jgi:hypothetical protein